MSLDFSLFTSDPNAGNAPQDNSPQTNGSAPKGTLDFSKFTSTVPDKQKAPRDVPYQQGFMEGGKLVFKTVTPNTYGTISAPDESGLSDEQKAAGKTNDFGADWQNAINKPTVTYGEKLGNITDTLLISGKLPTGLNWARNVIKAGYDTIKGTVTNITDSSDNLLNVLEKGQVIDTITGKPKEEPASTPEKIAALGKLGLAVGFAYPPFVQLSAELNMGSKLPNIIELPEKYNIDGQRIGLGGDVFGLINKGFQSIGKAGTFVSDTGLDWIPDSIVSKKDKEALRPTLNELGAFVSQMVSMIVLHKVVGGGLGGEKSAEVEGNKTKVTIIGEGKGVDGQDYVNTKEFGSMSKKDYTKLTQQSGLYSKLPFTEGTKQGLSTGLKIGAGLVTQPFSTAFGLTNGMLMTKIAQRNANDIKIDKTEFKKIVEEVKNEIPQKIEVKVTDEQNNNLKSLADKHLSGPETKKTAPVDITNKLTDEGYSKSDISRIVNDLYQTNPKGDFTEEQISQAKENYIPKGKDSATIIADLTEKGYTPEEQNIILKNLNEKNPDGNFLRADINEQAQALKGEDLYKSEEAKAVEDKRNAEARAQAITEKETAKAKAETEKFNAKVEIVKKAETKAKSEHESAKNSSELAKGKIEEAKSDYEKSQKDQGAAQKRLQEANGKERGARIALDQSKAAVVEKQAKGVDRTKIMKAKSKVAKARVDLTKAKVELEQAKEDAKNSSYKEKRLKAEFQKAKTEAMRAEALRIKARKKYVEAQKNIQEIKKGAPNRVTQMFSSKLDEDLTFDQAVERVKSPEHESMKKNSIDINKKYGAKTISTQDFVGDTKIYGDENSIIQRIEASPEDSRKIAAEKGLTSNPNGPQKTVLNFVHDNKGPDAIISFKMPEGLTSDQIIGILNEKGLDFRSIDKNTNEVVIYSENGSNLGIIDKLTQEHGIQSSTEWGKGEFIGSDVSRDDARRVYEEILGQNKAGNSNADNQPSSQAQEVKPTQETTPQKGGDFGFKEGNKVGKNISEVNAKLVEEGFKILPEEEQAKYSASTKKQQLERVSELLTDKENFKNISVGNIELPEGVKGSVVWNTARAMAYKDGDFEWFTELGSSPLGAESSKAASELSLSRFGKSEDRAEVAVSKNIKMAEEAIKNSKAEKSKDSIIKETEETIKKEADKQTLDDFLDENKC